ncbi:hypothetical protein [Streptomyces sp. NPDC004266]|uniref:hypothetical protein n=1 Tax=Streptomyces sp. NPDC004266 TaxID=3364693 RepID=UPI0036D10466
MRPGTDATENGLRHLLNEWDPIGVADHVQDEYDCMLAPLLQRLRGDADQGAIGGFLRHELEDHFGLDPLGLRPDAMAARVIDWWATVGKAGGTSCVQPLLSRPLTVCPGVPTADAQRARIEPLLPDRTPKRAADGATSGR